MPFDLWHDIRFAARLLIKDRWFTLAAATALALGIGANAAVFTFVNAVLVRGRPFHEADRIMTVWTEDDRGRRLGTSELDYEDWREEARSFSDLAATLGSPINVTQDIGKPYWMEFTMDGTVFAFIAAICLATGVLFGLAPALHVSKTDVNEVLKEGGRGGSGGVRVRRWTRTLIIAELALTLVLLAGAGFMMRSFLTLYQMDTGLDTSRLTMQIYLPLTKYPEVAPRTELFRRFEERLAGISAIKASAMATAPPFGGGGRRPLAIDGRPTPVGVEPPVVTTVSVGDDYFDTIGVQLLRGRAFTAADGLHGQESAIVNRRFVAIHFADEDPIGRRIKLEIQNRAPDTPEPAWLTIAGVAPDIRQGGLQNRETDPVVYVPHRTESPRSGVMIVRTLGDPAAVTALVRDTMRVLEPDLPLFDIRTLDQQLAEQRWQFQIFGTMFATFALIALVLSAVGLYAVTSYSVTRRTQEIGLRVALGARPGQVQ